MVYTETGMIMDKMKFNPWLPVFAVIGLAIIGTLHELIVATRESSLTYSVWLDMFGKEPVVEGEYTRITEATIDVDLVDPMAHTSASLARGMGGRL